MWSQSICILCLYPKLYIESEIFEQKDFLCYWQHMKRKNDEKIINIIESRDLTMLDQ